MEPTSQKTSRNLIAVWRWRRRTWVLVLPIVFAMYVLSAVPVTFAAHKTKNQLVMTVASLPFLPVVICAKHLPALDSVMEWEFSTLANCFGPS